MSRIFPELAAMPAPGWVKPGVVFTVYSASAIAGGEGVIFQLDPQGNIYATDGSGKRWSVRAGGGRPDWRLEDSGHSGHGFAQSTVLAVSAESAALAADLYTIGSDSNSPKLVARGSFIGLPGALADYWVNPGWLAKMKAGRNGPFAVSFVPWHDARETREAVAFGAEDGSSLALYDKASGVMLYRGGSGVGELGDPPPLTINGILVDNDEPSRLIFLSALSNRRSPSTPWSNQPSPAWVDNLASLRYSGQTGAVIPGCPYIPMPVTTSFEARTRGDGWICFHVTQSVGGDGGLPPIVDEFEWVSGARQLGGLWVNPAALATMGPGQVLDRDDDIGFVTAVGAAQQAPGGLDLVTITRTGTAQTVEYGYYRKTGILTYYGQQDRSIAATTVLRVWLDEHRALT